MSNVRGSKFSSGPVVASPSFTEPMRNRKISSHVKHLNTLIPPENVGSLQKCQVHTCLTDPRKTEIIDPIFKCRNKFELLRDTDLSNECCLSTKVLQQFKLNDTATVKEQGKFVTIRKSRRPMIILRNNNVFLNALIDT